jgi:L-lactate dehydrogenase complex protein LldF
MNHCPVYAAVGGHAYGSVYPGPIGVVLTPALVGLARSHDLPNASTFCGRCEAVCPMKIPLPGLMRLWREREFQQKLTPAHVRAGLKAWAFFAKRPRLYHLAARMAARTLGALGRGKGRLATLPLASGWTRHRDLPAPQGRTFQQLWAERERVSS